MQDGSALYNTVLRPRNRQHLQLQSTHYFQYNMPVRHFSLLTSPSLEPKLTTCRVCSFILIFIEIPLLLRICPTSSKFDALIRRFTTNYMRAAVYAAMSVSQWLSLIIRGSSLIAAAVVLLIAACFYAAAGLKGQGFVGSKTLGGQGVAQMIV